MTNVELAERVGLTAPPCLRRVRALEEVGAIRGYHADLEPAQLGFPITVFALAVALAALGLHRAKLAGALMVTLALVQLGATVLGVLVRAAGEGPGPGAMLGGSSGVVVLPVLVAGAMFWLAGVYADEHVRPVWPQVHPVA